ncbi:MAG: PKD domain-containing protein [Candidatus Thermoplasmatota archaeon]
MRRGALLSVGLLLALVLSGCASKSDDSSTSSTAAPSVGSTESGAPTSSDSPSSGAAPSSGAPSSSGAPASSGSNAAPVITVFAANVTDLSVTFSITATDANNDALTYVLSFGDATANVTGTLPTANVTHAFAAAGNYSAKLVVSDGKLSVNNTVLVQLSVVAAGAGPVDHRECSGTFGTNPGGVSGNLPAPIGPIGGCPFGTAATAVKVVALTGTTGCDHDASPTGASNAYGTAVTVGSEFPEGAAFRLICDVGVPTFSGTLDLTAV